MKTTSGVQSSMESEKLSKWLAQEQMDQELGPLKARHWRESGNHRLESHTPDPTSPAMVITRLGPNLHLALHQMQPMSTHACCLWRKRMQQLTTLSTHWSIKCCLIIHYHYYTPGLLTTRPDLLTGSTLPHMLEYQIFYIVDKEGHKEYYDHGVAATSKPENPMEAMSDMVTLGHAMLGNSSASSVDIEDGGVQPMEVTYIVNARCDGGHAQTLCDCPFKYITQGYPCDAGRPFSPRRRSEGMGSAL